MQTKLPRASLRLPHALRVYDSTQPIHINNWILKHSNPSVLIEVRNLGKSTEFPSDPVGLTSSRTNEQGGLTSSRTNEQVGLTRMSDQRACRTNEQVGLTSRSDSRAVGLTSRLD
ncbi:hypothetical protein J6590_026262 [Homalodisca vitripennis]|nr:hypothetical protein J6590_026262 [Homalodisca vitripennis]